MTMFIFRGRVIPEVRAITLPRLEPISLTEADGFAAVFAIAIEDGRITVTVEGPSDSDEDFNRCSVRARGFCTSMLDVLSFSTGWWLLPVLDVGVCGGEERKLAMSETSVAALVTAYSSQDGFAEVIRLVSSNPELSFAFHDLTSGLGTQNYSAIAAGRAVEAVRHLLAPGVADTASAWAALRDKLRFDRSYLDVIMSASINPRHGVRGKTSGDEQMEVTHRAWTVMNRYIAFLRRGGAEPLPLAEFPVLS